MENTDKIYQSGYFPLHSELIVQRCQYSAVDLIIRLTADCQPMLVFFSCSQSAPDMPL